MPLLIKVCFLLLEFLFKDNILFEHLIHIIFRYFLILQIVFTVDKTCLELINI